MSKNFDPYFKQSIKAVLYYATSHFGESEAYKRTAAEIKFLITVPEAEPELPWGCSTFNQLADEIEQGNYHGAEFILYHFLQGEEPAKHACVKFDEKILANFLQNVDNFVANEEEENAEY